MPTINIYGKVDTCIGKNLVSDFKQTVADLLSCDERKLVPQEISLRLLPAETNHMLADIECDIFAAQYPQRVLKQDEICNQVRDFLIANIAVQDAKVWLMLSEM